MQEHRISDIYVLPVHV